MSENKSKADMVYNCVSGKLHYINSISETGPGKAILAQLRRGAGKKPGELPELWGMIFEKVPDELLGKNEVSYAEWAIYTALTLYAVHRQGSDKDVDLKDVSLGQAAAGLVHSEDDIERIMHRMNLVVTAVSKDDLAYHTRSLIQLLKSENIGLDYARLSKELYLFNYPEKAEVIKLRWGRDFYGVINNKNKKGDADNDQ